MYRGGIEVKDKCVPGLIRLGYHEADAVDIYGSHTILSIENHGKLIFSSDAHVGHGAIIHIKSGALMTVGANFAISGTTSIVCNNKIVFGNDVQTSWNSLITDSDAHFIYSEDDKCINASEPIHIGNHVWIAANTTILKGSVISDNTVVASNSLVNKKFNEGSCIIGGCPAHRLKSIGSFKI